MNSLTVFNNAQFGSVRIFEREGDLWFVAKDVAEILEIQNIRQNLADLDEDERGVCSIDTLGGKQEMATVSEPGLYSLALRSRKPEARLFKRWITHEVIPSIRRNGLYATPQAVEAMLADPDDHPHSDRT